MLFCLKKPPDGNSEKGFLMRIEICQPHPDYPFAWVNLVTEVSATDEQIEKVLTKNSITILAPWETHVFSTVDKKGWRAPALLEDQHTKPRKKKR